MSWKTALHGAIPGAARAARIALMLLAGLPPWAGAADFELEGKAPGEDVDAIVQDDGAAWLTLRSTAGIRPAEVTLSLSPFRDEEGKRIAVTFAADDTASGAATTRNLTLQEWTMLRLEASSAALGRVYRGQLLVTRAPAKAGEGEPGGGTPGSVEPDLGTVEVFTLTLHRRQPEVFQGVRAGAAEQVVNVPAEGVAPIQFDAGSDSLVGRSVAFTLGLFTSETDGRVARVLFHRPPADTPAEPADALEVTLARRRLRLDLDASAIGFDEIYAGELRMEVEGHALEPVTLKIKRHEAQREATLSVSQPVAEESVCPWSWRGWWGWWAWHCVPDPIAVQINEPSGQHPLVGLSVATVAGEPIEGGLQPVRDLSVSLLRSEDGSEKGERYVCPVATAGTGAARVDLWRMDPDDGDDMARRTLPAQARGTLCIAFRRPLAPGSYKIPLQVQALNADPSKLPTLTVNVTVKHHVGWPLSVVILALLLSYVLTKLIRTQLQRTALENRLEAIDETPWLKKDWSILPIVRLNALRAQIGKALGYQRPLARLLYFPEVLGAKLARVEARLPHLQRLCALRSHWDESNHDLLVRNRAQKTLRDIVGDFTAAPLRSDPDASVLARLASLEEWRDETKLLGHYWLSLKEDILQLWDQVRLGNFDGPDLAAHRTALEATATSTAAPDVTRAVNESLAGFEQALGPNPPATLGQALADASAALTHLKAGDLERIGEKLAATALAVVELKAHGPQPALEAIAGARQAIAAGALRKHWPVLVTLHEQLAANPSVGPGPTRNDLLRALETLSGWAPDKLEATLTAAQVALTQSRDCDREVVRALRASLRPDEQPADLSEAIRRGDAYSRLKLIWGADRTQLRPALLDMQRSGEPLQEMFTVADRWAWKRLQPEGCLRVESSVSGSPTDIGAFDLIDFRVSAQDAQAMNTYLFKHGLIYDWTLSYEPTGGGFFGAAGRWLAQLWSLDGSGDRSTTIRTDEPRLSYFVPVAARDVKMSVTALFDKAEDGDKKQGEPGELRDSFTVGKANIFGVVAAFQRVELAALAIALAAAIGTATQSQQYQDALTGSLAAYVALFVWGFAADQVKNLLENIRTLTGPQE